MIDDGESEGNWEDDFQRARDFMSGFKIRASVVPDDEKPFYEALTTLIDSAMTGDKIIADRIAQLPEEDRRTREEGFFLSYGDRREDMDEAVFTTSRTGWANPDIGPTIEAHQTPEGNFIRLSTTGVGFSEFNISLTDSGRLIRLDVHDNGRVEGVFARELNRQVVVDDLQFLTSRLRSGDEGIQRRLRIITDKDSGGSTLPF